MATNQELQAQIDQLRAENAALAKKGISVKVSAKGAVSVYGLGRYPVTLYQEQWGRLLGMKETIQSFIEANKSSLAVKDTNKSE